MASNNSQPLQGMSDIEAPEVFLWQHLESLARSVFVRYDFSEIRTPTLEHTKVFTRSIGNGTDIVQKEMYTFEDRGGRSLTMRPEGTAGVVRYLSGIGQDAQDARVFYIAPMYRAERPQAGRKRQFHQCGVEMVGDPNPYLDAECIALQLHLLEAWGLSGCSLQINTRGEAGETGALAEKLKEQLQPQSEYLCDDCQRRIETNVLRVLDCKNPACKDIVDKLPPLTEFMSDRSREYFDNVVDVLKDLGLNPEINPRLVRGLDYYNHTVWEITHESLGAQDALAGGGRYTIGKDKKAISGAGFAIGMERVLMALEAQGVTGSDFARGIDAWLVSMGEDARESNFKLAQELRKDGLSCNMDLQGRSMKAQMRAANRADAKFVVIRGENEMERNILLLKDMESGEQTEESLESLREKINK